MGLTGNLETPQFSCLSFQRKLDSFIMEESKLKLCHVESDTLWLLMKKGKFTLSETTQTLNVGWKSHDQTILENMKQLLSLLQFLVDRLIIWSNQTKMCFTSGEARAIYDSFMMSLTTLISSISTFSRANQFEMYLVPTIQLWLWLTKRLLFLWITKFNWANIWTMFWNIVQFSSCFTFTMVSRST